MREATHGCTAIAAALLALAGGSLAQAQAQPHNAAAHDPAAHNHAMHDHAAHERPSGPLAVPVETKSRNYFGDAELLDQHGRRLKFYTDALHGKIVLINVLFTECKDACPMMTRVLVRARGMLDPAVRQNVRFVSISVDPERDTPAELLKFARKQEADHPDWLFLTGSKPNITAVANRLGYPVLDPQMHSTQMLAGNTVTGHWVKLRPDADSASIAMQLRELSRK